MLLGKLVVLFDLFARRLSSLLFNFLSTAFLILHLLMLMLSLLICMLSFLKLTLS